jgi:UDP-N-acetylmuramyl pentapeptide phosphotransferase/UDP-N-acetylglucosamine-1-phosphate transferase
MHDGGLAALGGLYAVALVIFGIVLVIAWIILPFALIGTKSLLRQLLMEAKETNKLLRQIAPKHPEQPISPATDEKPYVTVR